MSSINSIRTFSPDNLNFISLARFPRIRGKVYGEREREEKGEGEKEARRKREREEERGGGEVNVEHSRDDKYPEVSFPASNRSFFREDRERSSLFLFLLFSSLVFFSKEARRRPVRREFRVCVSIKRNG